VTGVTVTVDPTTQTLRSPELDTPDATDRRACSLDYFTHVGW